MAREGWLLQISKACTYRACRRFGVQSPPMWNVLFFPSLVLLHFPAMYHPHPHPRTHASGLLWPLGLTFQQPLEAIFRERKWPHFNPVPTAVAFLETMGMEG